MNELGKSLKEWWDSDASKQPQKQQRNQQKESQKQSFAFD